MKKILCVLLLFSLNEKSFGQNPENVKTVFISDERKKGILPYDCSIAGHTNGEVYIQWGKELNWSKEKVKHRKDTIEVYKIHFYKPDLTGELKNYQVGWSEDGIAYDRATYYWTSDTTVSITLIVNDTDHKRTITLVQFPHHPTWSAGMQYDNGDLPKKKKHKKV